MMPKRRDVGGGTNDDFDEEESLVTATSLALSLSPPRAPPHGTAHRMLLAARDPSSAPNAHPIPDMYGDVDGDSAHSAYDRHGFKSRIKQILDAAHLDVAASSHPASRGSGGTSKAGSSKGVGLTAAGRRIVRRLPHPHLPAGPELADRATRALGAALPLRWQHAFRDNGKFRSLADSLVTASVPTLALTNWSACVSFLNLTERRVEVRYGRHEMQKVDLFEPSGSGIGSGRGGSSSSSSSSTTPPPQPQFSGTSESRNNRRERKRGLLFFVHGGAWGSGRPWMYRLVALPFLEMGFAVAIAGYRTYPDADAREQVQDVQTAARELRRKRPDLWRAPPQDGSRDDGWIGTCLMGHSSGAHVSLSFVVDLVSRRIEDCNSWREKRRYPGKSPGGQDGHCSAESNVQRQVSLPLEFDFYIGLSGPYNISHHFDYEAGRGVEELSPMKPSCGHSRDSFLSISPVIRLQRILAHVNEGCNDDDDDDDDEEKAYIGTLMPRVLLLHGIEDSTVPFTSTSEAARILRSCGVMHCEEIYVAKTGHQDVIMHFMLGGKAMDEVMSWIQRAASKCLHVSDRNITVVSQSSL